jgi:hypothetical protein
MITVKDVRSSAMVYFRALTQASILMVGEKQRIFSFRIIYPNNKGRTKVHSNSDAHYL